MPIAVLVPSPTQRLPASAGARPASANRPSLCLVRPGGHWVQRAEPILGRLVRVEVWSEQRSRGEAAVAAVLHEVHRIERVVGPHLPGHTLRREASWRSAMLAPELTRLIEAAMHWAQHCQAAFDPAATDRNPQAGLQLDLRACARAHAVDRCLALLRERELVQARVVAGGSQGVIGAGREAADGSFGVADVRTAASPRPPWTATLEHPAQPGHGVVLPVRDGTLVSAADEALAVAVMSDSALAGEALSRGLLHLGVQRGLGLMQQWPAMQAVFVDERGQTHTTAEHTAR